MTRAVMSPAGMAAVGGGGVLAVSAVGIWATVKAVEGLAKAYRGVLREAVKLSEELDTVGKKARSIGADPEQFQTLIGAMQLSGIESDKAMKALQKLNQGMGEAMKGTKSYTDAFDALNLSAADLARIPLTERMLLISDGMDNLATNAERAQVAGLLLGRTGKDMLVTFEGGRAGLQAAIEDIARFGVASNEAVTASEDLQDSILRSRKALFGLKTKALEPMLLPLSGVADGFAEIAASLPDESVVGLGERLAASVALLAIETMRWAKATHALLIVTQPMLKAWIAVSDPFNIGAIQRFKLLKSGMQDMVGAAGKIAKSTAAWDENIRLMVGAIKAASDPMRQLDRDLQDRIDALDRERESWTAGKPGKPGKPGAPGESVAERQRRADEEALERFRKSGMSKLEIARLAHEGRVALIQRTAKDQADAWALEGRSYQEFMDTKRQLFDELIAHERAELEDLNRRQEEALKKQEEAAARAATRYAREWQGAFGAIASMVEQLSALMITVMGEENEEAKKAAKVMFGISQSMHIARATVAMFDAIAQANALGYPQSVPAMIVAGATGAANIAAIVATTIQGVADAGLPPGALRAAGLNNHTMLAIRNDEMVLDPVGTRAISEMLTQRSGGQPTVVNTVLEIDGHVLGQTVDTHLIRSQERGLPYGERARYGSA